MALKTSASQLLATKNYYQRNKKSIIAKNIAYYQLHKVEVLAKKKIRDANKKAKLNDIKPCVKHEDIPSDIKSLKSWWKINIKKEFETGLFATMDDMMANHPVVLKIKELQSKDNTIIL